MKNIKVGDQVVLSQEFRMAGGRKTMASFEFDSKNPQKVVGVTLDNYNPSIQVIQLENGDWLNENYVTIV